MFKIIRLLELNITKIGVKNRFLLVKNRFKLLSTSLLSECSQEKELLYDICLKILG